MFSHCNAKDLQRDVSAARRQSILGDIQLRIEHSTNCRVNRVSIEANASLLGRIVDYEFALGAINKRCASFQDTAGSVQTHQQKIMYAFLCVVQVTASTIIPGLTALSFGVTTTGVSLMVPSLDRKVVDTARA